MNKRYISNQSQLYLPFSEARSHAITLEDRQRFFWFMASVSLFSLGIYIYAINAAAHHIAVRQNLESEVQEIHGRLSSLEFDSIALKNAITIDTAREYGFTEVKEPLYVSRSSSQSLTLNTVSR
jgi:hypothetical protein